MPPKAPPEAWTPMPPVTAGEFSFVNNEFFAVASNHNLHRRATPAEVKNHFNKGSEKDYPAHWFEAQLRHYGLPVSKTKSVARMRLLDASKGGKLVVPAEVSMLEGQLKKEWGKNDREAKKKVKDAEVKTGTGSKRKAESTAVSNTMKKPKTDAKATGSTAAKQTAAKPKTTPVKTNVKTETASKGASISAQLTQFPGPAPDELNAFSASPHRTKQTARSIRGARNQSSIRKAPGLSSHSLTNTSASVTPIARPKQTARRGRPFGMQAHHARSPTPDDTWTYDHPLSSGYKTEGSKLPKLGYLNGDYDVDAPYVTDQWPHYGSGFAMTLTLSGDEMRASFDFGVISGVMHFPNRPRRSSRNKIPFKWRGREDEGPISYGDNHDGWISFLGGGLFEGRIDFMGIEFKGLRSRGQGTTSSRSAGSLESEWDGYSEREYEHEAAARWR